MSAQPAPRQAPALAITDHALLRWMERVHGIDVDTWRRLCREAAEGALNDFVGIGATCGPAFIVDPEGTVVTFLGAGQRLMRPTHGATAIATSDRT